MKKLLLFILLAGVSLASCSQETKSNNSQTKTADSIKVPKVVITHNTDSLTIVEMLQQANELPQDTNQIMFFAKKFIGLPYVGYTLDQNKEEALVINTKGVDCTTYVENVLALTVCAKKKITDFEGFCNVLKDVRYIGGKVGYTTRQHYFTIWMEDNIKDGLVERVILPDPPLSANRTPFVNYMTTHVASYRMLNAHKAWLPEIKAMEDKVSHTTFPYIPKQQLKDSNKYRDYINDGDIIAIVTNKAGLDVSHVGFASWHKDGLHLLNASSLHKKVIDEPMTLYQYLQKQKTSVGITLVRVK